MPNVTTVFFDLYNTLVPFSPAEYEGIVAQMALALGIPHRAFGQRWQDTWTQYELGVLPSTGAHIRHISETLGYDVTVDQVGVAEKIHYRYQQSLLSPPTETINVLAELRRRGYPLGIISNCPLETPILWPASRLAPLVDLVLFSPLERTRKPDPQLFHRACTRINCTPNECLMIGDSWEADIVGATNAGLQAIWLNPGREACPQSNATIVIGNLSELLALLRSD